MRVSVEDNLTDLKKYLARMGYDVHNFSDSVISDAYVYSETNTGLINLANMISGTGTGSLLIDVDGKNPEEIHNILSHRVYSPLFSSTDNEAINPFKMTYNDREV